MWDLSEVKLKTTIEGHSAEVMSIKIFSAGGDAALASASQDCTVRVLYDFLGAVPKDDVIKQLFDYDILGVNAHINNSKTGPGGAEMSSAQLGWPRISEVVQKSGADQFFSFQHHLFREALVAQRSDFLTEFLPLTKTGLVKSNFGEVEPIAPEGGEQGKKLLLPSPPLPPPLCLAIAFEIIEYGNHNIFLRTPHFDFLVFCIHCLSVCLAAFRCNGISRGGCHFCC